LPQQQLQVQVLALGEEEELVVEQARQQRRHWRTH